MAAALLAPAAACNTPPGTPQIELSPAEPLTADPLVLSITNGAADPNGDEVDYRIAWLEDGEPREDLRGFATVVPSHTAKGETWEVEVRAWDGRAEGSPVGASLTIGNTAPEAGVDVVVPVPSASEDVVAEAWAHDLDGDEVSLAWSWTRNGEATGLDGATVPADQTVRGDVWEVTVVPSDGESEGEASTARASIANNLPEVVSVTLSPAEVFEDTVVSAVVDATDDDGDEVSLDYEWTVDGLVVQSGEEATLTGDSFDKHDLIAVEVTPHDGLAAGDSVTSEAVEVSNTPPTLTSVALSTSELVESSEVSCVPSGFADADGDPEGYVWAWFVNGGLVSSEPTLTGASFSRGQSVRCEVAPDDGEDLGELVSSVELEVGNTLPVVGSATLSTTSPSEGDVVTVSVDDVFDADGDEVELSYTWYVAGAVASTDEELTSASFAKGDRIYVAITPSDSGGVGDAVRSNEAVAVNSLPEVTSLSLSPSDPTTDTVLTASATTDDADGESVDVLWTWYVDGVPLPVGDDELDGATWFDKGEVVWVVARPDDGTDRGPGVTSEVLSVVNSAPAITDATIDPAVVREDTTVSCLGSGWSDADGDPEDYRVSWTLDGTWVSDGDTLDGSSFDKGERIGCELTPFDGEDEGEPVAAETVRVRNTAPVLGGATLSTLAPQEGDILSVSLTGAYDADDDGLSYEYEWWVSGSMVSSDPTLSSDDFRKTDTIYAVVSPFDGTAHGDPVTSDVATAVNTPPEVLTFSIRPDEPYTDSYITTMTSYRDEDSDDVDLVFTWFVDDVEIGFTGSPLDGDDWFDKGQEVYAVVTPWDDDEAGTPVTSGTLEVLNSKPSITSVGIEPAVLKTETTATCVPYGWDDADGDAEEYVYAWTVGGTPVGSEATLSGDAFDRTELVVCTVTPTNGGDDGDAVSSAAIEVVNTAPVIGAAHLSSTAPAVEDTLSVGFTGLYDADGDTPEFLYAWYTRAGGHQASTPTFTGFDRGDEVWVVVTPYDDYDSGTPVESDHAFVGNTAPEILTLELSETEVYTDTELYALTTTFDADGDDVVLSFEWYDTVGLIGEDDELLDGVDWFDKGQEIYVVVTPHDGFVPGASETSETVEVLNTEPLITGVALDPPALLTGTDVECVPSGWYDPDPEDAEDYEFIWTVSGVEAGSEATLDHTAFVREQLVQCTATPTDGDDLGVGQSSAVVEVGNTPPTLASATLSDTAPPEGETLSVTLGAVDDADGDLVDYRYQWYVAGEEAGEGATLSSASFDKGEDIYVEVTPFDTWGDDGEVVESDHATAVNTLPWVDEITIAPIPEDVYTGTLLEASVSITDPDPADELLIGQALDWYVNDALVYSGATELSGETWFDKGDEVYLAVTPSDPVGDGETAVSSTILVLNTPPTVAEARLSPTSFGTEQDVDCEAWGWDDPDEDDPQNPTYTWEVNSSVVATGETLDSSEYVRGDEVQCVLTPNDGEEDGPDTLSALVEVVNTVPTLEDVTLDDLYPQEGDTVSAVLGAYTDADSDTVYFDYVWYVDDAEVGYDTYVGSDVFDKDDDIYLEVTPYDLFGGSANYGTLVVSDLATAVNTLPTISGVELDTDTIVEATTVACLGVDWYDPDPADSEDYLYDWYVGGSLIAETGDSIDGDSFDKDQTVQCHAAPWDGEEAGTSYPSEVVVVGNTPPGDPGVDLVPEGAIAGVDDLYCDIVTDAYDPDPADYPGSAEWEYDFAWYYAGASWTGATTETTWPGDTIPGAETVAGEWTCEVYVTDGDDDGGNDYDTVTVEEDVGGILTIAFPDLWNPWTYASYGWSDIALNWDSYGSYELDFVTVARPFDLADLLATGADTIVLSGTGIARTELSLAEKTAIRDFVEGGAGVVFTYFLHHTDVDSSDLAALAGVDPTQVPDTYTTATSTVSVMSPSHGLAASLPASFDLLGTFRYVQLVSTTWPDALLTGAEIVMDSSDDNVLVGYDSGTWRGAWFSGFADYSVPGTDARQALYNAVVWTANPRSPYTIGNYDLLPDTGGVSANYLLGTSIEVTEPATLTDFGFIGTSAGGNFKMALYTDSFGSPDAYVASTPSTPHPLGRVEVPVAEVSLDPGTYWLLNVYDSLGNPGYQSSGSTVMHRSLSFSSAMPDPFGTATSYCCREFNYYIVVY